MLLWLARTTETGGGGMEMAKKGAIERLLFVLAVASWVWLAVGLALLLIRGGG